MVSQLDSLADKATRAGGNIGSYSARGSLVRRSRENRGPPVRAWSNGGLRPELSSGEWLPHRVRGRVPFAISIPQFVEDGPFDTLAFRFSEAQGCSQWLLSVRVEDRRFGVPVRIPVRVEDRRFGVPVRIQYAAAFNRRVSLGAVPYSEWLGRSHSDRTRLTVRPRPTTPSRKRNST